MADREYYERCLKLRRELHLDDAVTMGERHQMTWSARIAMPTSCS